MSTCKGSGFLGGCVWGGVHRTLHHRQGCLCVVCVGFRRKVAKWKKGCRGGDLNQNESISKKVHVLSWASFILTCSSYKLNESHVSPM